MSGGYIYILGSLIGTINPEFKDLAQSCGWKMITVHEKM